MEPIKNKSLILAVDEIVHSKAFDPEQVYKHANKLWYYIEALMYRRKVKDLYEVKSIEDILKASALLYKLFIVEERISTFLHLREFTAYIFDNHGISKEIQNMIFQMCESYLGEDSPAEFMIPAKGYPDDLFADAIFIMKLKENTLDEFS